MKRKLKDVFSLLKKASVKFKKDDPVRLAGTAAYFMIFAMAPIIIIIVSLIGMMLGEETIQEKIFVEINKLIGENGTQFIRDLLPELTIYLLKAGNLVISFGVIMLILAMIYKFLPDAKIKWKVTWMGAFITSLLFMIGKALIGLFIGNSNISPMYGAAGSLIVILLWVFYSTIIFFYGAEITYQYASMYSRDIQPKNHAVRIQVQEITEED